jgi:hypothetical protein
MSDTDRKIIEDILDEGAERVIRERWASDKATDPVLRALVDHAYTAWESFEKATRSLYEYAEASDV